MTFYKHLYTSKASNVLNPEDSSIFFSLENDTVLTEDEQKTCEGYLTEKECLEALRSVEPNKIPGSNGLPAEFYKVFWKEISTTLIRALNYSYESGQLSITQRRGIIKLIPKKDAEPYFIKNWRPLTLLNCDYKIAAKSKSQTALKLCSQILSTTTRWAKRENIHRRKHSAYRQRYWFCKGEKYTGITSIFRF